METKSEQKWQGRESETASWKILVLFQARWVASRKLNETRMSSKMDYVWKVGFPLFVHEINPRSFIFCLKEIYGISRFPFRLLLLLDAMLMFFHWYNFLSLPFPLCSVWSENLRVNEDNIFTFFSQFTLAYLSKRETICCSGTFQSASCNKHDMKQFSLVFLSRRRRKVHRFPAKNLGSHHKVSVTKCVQRWIFPSVGYRLSISIGKTSFSVLYV